jgi:carbonic anhydrase
MPVGGTRQSPIKIMTAAALELASPHKLFAIKYRNRKHHGVFIGDPKHGNFKLDKPFPVVHFCGDVYELRRIHIHHKSEHLIDTDDNRDFEVHLVHALKGKSLDDAKLVIGILYHESARGRAGKGLDIFNQILHARAQAGASLRVFLPTDPVPDGDINPLDFFPRAGNTPKPDLTNWFYYEGSLTSEPYTEDVSWFVMKNESKINPSKLVDLERYAEQEARHYHPLDRRIVAKSFR